MVHRDLTRIARRLVAGLLIAAGATAAQAQPSYKVIEVPVYTDPFNTTVLTYAMGVNRSGQTAALLYQQLGGTAAFRCDKSGCLFVPPLGDTHHGGPSAEGINDAGLVVGTSPYLYFSRGYLFDGSSSLNLGAFDEGICNGCDLSSYAHGINNLGQVVGEGETAEGTYRAFIWQGGAMQKLGTLGGTQSTATAINDDGVVVGHATLADGTWHAFRFRNGKMRDLGTLGGSHSYAYAVNRGRQVVGCSLLAGDLQTAPFVHHDGVMAPLPTLGGSRACASGINLRGWVVGSAQIAGDTETHGFFYDGSTLVDLNDTLPPADRATWLITEANGINKKGQIAAVGLHKTYGSVRALLLSPRVLAAAPR